MFAKPIHTTITDELVTGFAAADLNGDAKPDLIAGAPRSGVVHVLIGAGDGTFTALASYNVGAGRGHLAVGDFNGDGRADVVAAGSGIKVLLGNGDGTLQPAVTSFGSAADVVVADFDGDGRQDIASVGKNSASTIPDTVDVYAGNGDGTFGPPHTLFTSDNSPAALGVGDFNADGRPDLVFGVRDIRQLPILINAGAFAFTWAGASFIEVGPSRTAVGDLDGNGTDDIVTANFVNGVSVLLGNGDGTLQPARTSAVGSAACTQPDCPRPQWVALADVDRDGRLDVVTAQQQPGSASVLLNDGTGGLRSPVVFGVHAFAYAAVAADFDADGAVDMAVASSEAAALDPGPRVVSIFLNRRQPRIEQRRMRWADVTNVSVGGTTVRKTAGCDGCFDAYVVSGDPIEEPGAGVQFSIGDPAHTVMAGLSSSFTGQIGDIEYGVLIGGGRAEVRERDVVRAAIDVRRGDTVQIAVLGTGRVSYFLNGAAFYTSGDPPAFPLRFVALLATMGARIGNVMRLEGLI